LELAAEERNFDAGSALMQCVTAPAEIECSGGVSVTTWSPEEKHFHRANAEVSPDQDLSANISHDRHRSRVEA
jgi:hypothetical protein